MRDHLDKSDEEETIELPYTTSPVLLDRNYALKREVWYHYDGEQVVFQTRQMVDHVLDFNKEVYNETFGKSWGEGQRVASIPMNVYYDKLDEAVQEKDDKYIQKFLNDSDYRKLRTFHGRTGKV